MGTELQTVAVLWLLFSTAIYGSSAQVSSGLTLVQVAVYNIQAFTFIQLRDSCILINCIYTHTTIETSADYL